jgi:ADP-ribose pyrophosphatase YjhB (NUDIX family)
MWVGGVRVVIKDSQNRILLVRQKHEGKDIWMLPGGAIEDGENALEAAVREVKEETELDVNIGPLLWHIEEVSESRGQRFVNYFLAESAAGEASLGYDPELGETQVLQEIRFFTKDEIMLLPKVYPNLIRDELWDLPEKWIHKDTFKIRT